MDGRHAPHFLFALLISLSQVTVTRSLVSLDSLLTLVLVSVVPRQALLYTQVVAYISCPRCQPNALLPLPQYFPHESRGSLGTYGRTSTTYR